MYHQAVSAGVPFFEWPKWIEKMLDRIYLDFMYKKKQLNSKSNINPLNVCINYLIFIEGHHFISFIINL